MKTKRKKGFVASVRERLLGALKNSPILVWYDPEGSFVELAPTLSLKGTEIIPFEGSYLQIRARIEEEDPKLEGRWLIYVPEPAPNPSARRD